MAALKQNGDLGIGPHFLGQRLESLRRVHRVADDGIVHARPGADVADHDRAAVDADAQVDRRLATGVVVTQCRRPWPAAARTARAA